MIAPISRCWPLCAVLLAGCANDSVVPLDDDDQIVRTVLGLLTSDGRTICVDSQTRGQPLAVFRTMREAPRATRQLLGWSPPGPLRAPTEPGLNEIWRNETKRKQLLLREPGNRETGNLPPLEQLRLNSNALTLSTIATHGVTINSGWRVPGVVARWGPRNWVAGDCEPRYVLTDPVRGADFAYLTVTAGHWGTTYSLDKVGGQWRGTAQWSTWLY